MAHIETWWECGLGHKHDTRREAERCALSHVCSCDWAVSDRYPGKAVRITRSMPIQRAIVEADTSDNIDKRKQQIAAREQRRTQWTEKRL